MSFTEAKATHLIVIMMALCFTTLAITGAVIHDNDLRNAGIYGLLGSGSSFIAPVALKALKSEIINLNPGFSQNELKILIADLNDKVAALQMRMNEIDKIPKP